MFEHADSLMDHDDAFTRHKLEVSDRAHADGEPTEGSADDAAWFPARVPGFCLKRGRWWTSWTC